MPPLPISAEQAAAGGSLWFAGKVLGPSADAMGEQLKAYFQARLPSIFGSAAVKAEARGVEDQLKPIAPGLLARLVADASFSADDPQITDWWANIMLDASLAGTNRHAVFSDIMAMVGPKEAACLVAFMQQFDSARPERIAETLTKVAGTVVVSFSSAANYWLGDLPITPQTFFGMTNNMHTGQVAWPLRPISWQFPHMNDVGHVNPGNGLNHWYMENIMEVEVLERAGVLRQYTAQVVNRGGSGSVTALAATSLGLDFYATCLGIAHDPASPISAAMGA